MLENCLLCHQVKLVLWVVYNYTSPDLLLLLILRTQIRSWLDTAYTLVSPWFTYVCSHLSVSMGMWLQDPCEYQNLQCSSPLYERVHDVTWVNEEVTQQETCHLATSSSCEHHPIWCSGLISRHRVLCDRHCVHALLQIRISLFNTNLYTLQKYFLFASKHMLNKVWK